VLVKKNRLQQNVEECHY